MANGSVVVGGTLQFGQSGLLTPIQAYLRGIPFKFVAPTGVYASDDSGQTRVLSAPHDAIAKRFTISDWFTTAAYIAANADVVRRFARALHAASVYANRHHAETVPLLAAFTNVDPQTIARSTREIFAETFEPRDFQPVIDAAARYGVIERRFDADVILSS